MQLQALLWDVDGTVAETERDGHRVAFNLAFAELGLDWGWTERRYGELLQVTGGRERLLADMAGRPDAPADSAAREDLARRLHALKNTWYAWLVREGRLGPRSGVLALVREAAAAGVRQAITTTTSRSNVQALMSRLLGPAWHDSFELVLCGEDTLRKKPDPEVYLKALDGLGLAPHEALALEDSPAGVQAAQGAGLAVLLRPSQYFPDPGATAEGVWTLAADAPLPGLAALQRWCAANAAACCLAQRGV